MPMVSHPVDSRSAWTCRSAVLLDAGVNTPANPAITTMFKEFMPWQS